MNKFTYSTEEYNFTQIIKDWFQTDDLTKLHEHKNYSEVFSRKRDQSTDWHKLFYHKVRYDKAFSELYKEFLLQLVRPRYNGEEIVFQNIPNLRVHLVGNVSVGEWHKDKYYRDTKWAERIKELNYYLPLTNTNEANTLWSESEEGKDDFSPMLLSEDRSKGQ